MSGASAPLRPGWIRDMRRALLAFYDDARRDLPWRRTSDPYRIWVSEVMLQQTRVDAVIPFYERWLARFPSIDALAEAHEDAVLKAWEGLGYYSRARNLQRAARLIRERHAGRVPDDASALRALPGVGDYTAGAIASIAFGRAEPAVDGNVRRVLARLLDERDPSPARLRKVAATLVPRDRPGDFNQALMELGATVCASRAPDCFHCPLARCCAARSAGTQHERPAPRPRRAVPVFDVATAVVIDARHHVLLGRRPDGMLAGLLSFPAVVVAPGEDARTAARRAVPFALPDACLPLGVIEHTFTHRKERYDVVAFEVADDPDLKLRSYQALDEAGLRWVAMRDIETVAMPVAQREIAEMALSGR